MNEKALDSEQVKGKNVYYYLKIYRANLKWVEWHNLL